MKTEPVVRQAVVSTPGSRPTRAQAPRDQGRTDFNRRLYGGLLVALLPLPMFAQADPQPAPRPGAETSAGTELGRWITGSGNLEVEIAPCGDALCGKVVRVIANRSMSKPDAEMDPVDKRPALGMQILSDFKFESEGERKGRIYNRENGKTYRCLMTLQSADELKIRPYVGIPWFGKTQTWHRAQAPEAPLSQR